MYIDGVSGTLQSLNDTAGTLARMKDATVQNKIRQAELLNRMGENKAAEEMFNQAQHYGLSSLFAPDTKAWEAGGAFESPDAIQLQGLNTLTDQAKKGDIAGIFGNSQGKGLDTLTGTTPINSDMVNTGIGKLDHDPKTFDPKKQYKTQRTLMADLQNNSEVKGNIQQFKKEKAANDQIEADNRKIQAYNDSIPQFRSSYEGDEPDQLNQLADDTMAAIKFYESQGTEDGRRAAAAAYNKYVQTGRAIADHYQHNFKPLGSEYFFSPKKGGGGGTGEKGDFHLYGDDPLTAQSIFIPESVYRKGEKAVDAFVKDNWPSIYKKGTRLKPAGKNQSDDYDAVKDQQARKLEAENDMIENARADDALKQAWGKTGRFRSNQSIVDEANNTLGVNSVYMFKVNDSGDIQKIPRYGSDNRGVARKTGTGGGNAVDAAIGD